MGNLYRKMICDENETSCEITNIDSGKYCICVQSINNIFKDTRKKLQLVTGNLKPLIFDVFLHYLILYSYFVICLSCFIESK